MSRALRSWALAGLGVAALASARPAAAQGYPQPTNRNFALDFFQGPVTASNRVLGLGGAATALAEGAEGLTSNPAAGAVQPFGKIGGLIADASFLFYVTDGKSDFVNDGLSSSVAGVNFIFGLAFALGWGRWAFGYDAQTTDWSALDLSNGASDDAVRGMDQTLSHLSLSRAFGDSLAVGVGFRFGTIAINDQSGAKIAQLDASGAEAGAVWRPAGQRWRFGLAASTAMTDHALSTSCPDPTMCDGLVLPATIRVPWQVSAGAAWRLGGSTWNEASPTRYKDERVLLLAADLVVTGAVSDGYGVGAYLVDGELQPSGRGVSLAPHLGLEGEALPGRLRLRAGTYLEPGRTPDSSYRPHLTGGLEVRLFALLGDRVRVQANAGFDAAPRYGAQSISVGLWH